MTIFAQRTKAIKNALVALYNDKSISVVRGHGTGESGIYINVPRGSNHDVIKKVAIETLNRQHLGVPVLMYDEMTNEPVPYIMIQSV